MHPNVYINKIQDGPWDGHKIYVKRLRAFCSMFSLSVSGNIPKVRVTFLIQWMQTLVCIHLLNVSPYTPTRHGKKLGHWNPPRLSINDILNGQDIKTIGMYYVVLNLPYAHFRPILVLVPFWDHLIHFR